MCLSRTTENQSSRFWCNPTSRSTLVSTDRLTLVGVKKGPRNVPSVLASLEIHALGKGGHPAQCDESLYCFTLNYK